MIIAKLGEGDMPVIETLRKKIKDDWGRILRNKQTGIVLSKDEMLLLMTVVDALYRK